MQKEQALQRLTALENEAIELRKILEQKDEPAKLTAKGWLLNFLSQDFTVKFTEGYITYYLDNQWIFQQDLKNGFLWCYYYKCWKVFIDDFSMNNEQIQALQKEVVGKALNCEVLTPWFIFGQRLVQVGKALNCEVLTPYNNK